MAYTKLRAFAVGLCWCAIAGPSHTAWSADTQATPRAAAVEFQVRNVNFWLAQDIILGIRNLRGQLLGTKPGVPVIFDDPDSFILTIASAEIVLTPSSLTDLINSYVLAYDGAPVKNVNVTINGNRLVLKGTVHKGVDLPFEIDGAISAAEDGTIRVHAETIKSAHVPIKGLLHLFDENLSKLVNEKVERGMKMVGDDIILTPRNLTPSPHLDGRVIRAEIARGNIVLAFDSGHPTALLTPPFPSNSYIYHRGGVLQFGKLTMDDADLEIVGDRPGTFDFFQREYLKQLVAGYSKTTSAKGLVAHMVGYSRVPQLASGAK